MKYVLGVDPGKTGGFCLLDETGKILWITPMPLVAGVVSAAGLAHLYREVFAIINPRWSSGQRAQDMIKPVVAIEKVQAMKHDGKVGMCTYFQGAGRLEMVALWGWPIVLIPPGTWCRAMHSGVGKDVKPKDKSRIVLSQLWPELYVQGSDIWPGRTKHPHEGMMDALLIGEFQRQRLHLGVEGES